MERVSWEELDNSLQSIDDEENQVFAVGDRVLRLTKMAEESEAHSIALSAVSMAREISDPADRLNALESIVGVAEMERARIISEL